MRKIDKVQYPMLFEVSLTASDVNDTVELDVPPNFVLLRTKLSVRTAFNGTTPTVGVTDNKDTPTEIIPPATVLTAVDDTDSTVNAVEYPAGGKITIAPVNAGGTTTAGAADVVLEGYIKGRQNERYGA